MKLVGRLNAKTWEDRNSMMGLRKTPTAELQLLGFWGKAMPLLENDHSAFEKQLNPAEDYMTIGCKQTVTEDHITIASLYKLGIISSTKS